ncbi:hypothetical protein QE152_g9512 [Popillia japonica]|uniref:Uncharacterized protein n=1 Tax=Popillia japonica TaxID=7064 RepID=A0AAW1LXX8_POPJA
METVNILKAVENIGASWKEVKPSCSKGAWSKLWPESTEDVDTVNIAETEEMVNDLFHFAHDVHTSARIMINFQEILNQDEEDVTPDDLLESFTAAAYDVTKHTENVTEITNLKLPATFSLIDKAMEIFTDPVNDESRSINLMIAVAKDVQCY